VLLCAASAGVLVFILPQDTLEITYEANGGTVGSVYWDAFLAAWDIALIEIIVDDVPIYFYEFNPIVFGSIYEWLMDSQTQLAVCVSRAYPNSTVPFP